MNCRLPKIFFLICLSVLILSCGLLNETGTNYLSVRGLLQDQDSKGFILIGTLGDDYPATVSGVKTAMHEISFVTLDGERKIYSGYYGYKLKVLELTSDAETKVFVVLRSKKKK
jgi:hypothetical protein